MKKLTVNQIETIQGGVCTLWEGSNGRWICRESLACFIANQVGGPNADPVFCIL